MRESPDLMDFWGLLKGTNYIKLASTVQGDLTAIWTEANAQAWQRFTPSVPH